MLFGEGPQIKNIAADLNKLFRQGSLLNQSGQTVEGDSTADQGTADLLAARDPVIQEISVGMSGEQSARYTVSGTPPLSLPNSLGKPLKAWEVDLLPYQEGTGDPAPDNVRPIYGTNQISFVTTGKNLLNQDNSDYINVQTRVYGNSDSKILAQLNALPEGTYTLSFNAKVTDLHGAPATQTNVGLYLRAINDGAQFDVNGQINVTPTIGTVLSKSVTFTLTSEYVGKFSYCYTYTGKNNIVQPEVIYEGIIYDVQIELSSTATPYTPYLAPSQTVLTLPSTVYTGTIGSEGGESRWGEADLGTLNYFYVSSGDVNAFRSNINALPVTDNSQHGITSIYPFAETRFTANMPDPSWMIDSQGRLFIRDDRYTDIPSLKAYLSGQNIVYELATPTTFSVPSVTIPTPTGTATTWATAEDGTVDSMEVTYVGKA